MGKRTLFAAALLVASVAVVVPQFVATADPTPGTISFVGSTFNGSARGSKTITVAKPGWVQPGDVMVAMLGGDYSIPGNAPGWTKFAQRDEHRDLTGQGFYRVATWNEPASYTWPIIRGNGKEIASVTIVAFRGVEAMDPIYSFAINAETLHSDEVSDCPSTSGIEGGALVCTWIHDDPQLPQAPAGMIQLSAFTIPNLDGRDDGHGTAYKLLNSDGPTGVQPATLQRRSGGGNDLAIAVVLRPAVCGGEAATVLGTENDDILIGTAGRDVIAGLGGSDRIRGLGGSDLICGGPGSDVIYGGPGADELYGGGGHDKLVAGAGADQLYGGRGNDRLYSGGGRDRVAAGAGDDTIHAHDDTLDRLFGGGGVDTATVDTKDVPRRIENLVTGP